MEEDGAAGTPSAPALLEEYALVEENGAAGTPAPPITALAGGFGGLTAGAALVGFLLGQHRPTTHAHRGGRAGPVVEVDVEEVVDVEEYEHPRRRETYRPA